MEISKKTKMRIKKWPLSILRFVIIFGLAFIILEPFVYKILMAFMHPDDLLDSTVWIVPRIGSTYYWQQALEQMKLPQSALNTFLLSLIVGVLQVFSCTMVGYGLARFNFKGNKLAFFVVILIMLVPVQVISIARYLDFNYLNIFGKVVSLTDTFWPVIILSTTGLGIKQGLYIYMMRELFRSLPVSIEEAAYIDGAGPIKTFTSVMLPNARTTMATVFVFSFCWQWTDTTYSSLYFNEMPVLANVVETMYIRVGLNPDPLATGILRNAAAILIMLPLIVLFVFGQKLLVKSMALSGLAN
ncbi:MAG: carbohydrate ABC transporter permease [Ruminococcaceae bacterium]|nr:carbohydrate ABC transporter permease [Oscillospiraceae bacterium]